MKLRLPCLLLLICFSTALFAQNLVSSTLLGAKTKAQLTTQFALPIIQYGVKYYRVTYATTALEAIQGADALVLVTEWNEFRAPDWDAVVAALRGRDVFDGRNIWEPEVVEGHGLRYTGIGRPRPSNP